MKRRDILRVGVTAPAAAVAGGAVAQNRSLTGKALVLPEPSPGYQIARLVFNNGQENVGALYWWDSKLRFTGEVDSSAQIFLDQLEQYFLQDHTGETFHRVLDKGVKIPADGFKPWLDADDYE